MELIPELVRNSLAGTSQAEVALVGDLADYVARLIERASDNSPRLSTSGVK